MSVRGYFLKYVLEYAAMLDEFTEILRAIASAAVERSGVPGRRAASWPVGGMLC